MSDEPKYTKEDRLIARLNIINSLKEAGRITDEKAAQMVGWNLEEYNNGGSVEKLQRFFGRKEKENGE